LEVVIVNTWLQRPVGLLTLAAAFLALAAVLEAPALAQKGLITSDSVVKAEVKAAQPDADGKQSFIVTLDIEKGWHLYANPLPKDFPGICVVVEVAGKSKPTALKVDYPPGKRVVDKDLGDHHIYEGKVEIKGVATRAKGDSSPLEVHVLVQACSDKKCLQEATIKLTAKE
jgi:thiol:disulfide interchange protein